MKPSLIKAREGRSVEPAVRQATEAEPPRRAKPVAGRRCRPRGRIVLAKWIDWRGSWPHARLTRRASARRSRKSPSARARSSTSSSSSRRSRSSGVRRPRPRHRLRNRSRLHAALHAGVRVRGHCVAALTLVLPTWAALLVVCGILLLQAGVFAALAVNRIQKGTPPLPEQAIEEARLTTVALKSNGR